MRLPEPLEKPRAARKSRPAPPQAAGRVPTCPRPPSWPVEGFGALPSPIFIKQSNSLLMRAAVFVPRSVCADTASEAFPTGSERRDLRNRRTGANDVYSQTSRSPVPSRLPSADAVITRDKALHCSATQAGRPQGRPVPPGRPRGQPSGGRCAVRGRLTPEAPDRGGRQGAETPAQGPGALASLSVDGRHRAGTRGPLPAVGRRISGRWWLSFLCFARAQQEASDG